MSRRKLQRPGQKLATMNALETLRTMQDEHARAEVEAEKAKHRFHAAVRAAHEAGASSIKIADVLGCSRQRVWQIVSGGRAS